MRVRGWSDFQHYKTRRPPWIKLHRTILDDADFMRLPLASRALAPLLWLLASESEDPGMLPSVEQIAWRLRMSESEVAGAIKPLVSNGFLDDASGVLADRKQGATPETETETEREAETEKRALPKPKCPNCEVVGSLQRCPPRNGNPAQWWCRTLKSKTFKGDGCGENYPINHPSILSQLTPFLRKEILAAHPLPSRPKTPAQIFAEQNAEVLGTL